MGIGKDTDRLAGLMAAAMNGMLKTAKDLYGEELDEFRAGIRGTGLRLEIDRSTGRPNGIVFDPSLRRA